MSETYDDRVASTLADVRERSAKAVPGFSSNPGTYIDSAADVPLLLAAIDKVLEKADELEHIQTAPPSGKEDEAAALGIRWCAAQFRKAITAALTGEAPDAGQEP